jgi:hypothetical protein
MQTNETQDTKKSTKKAFIGGMIAGIAFTAAIYFSYILLIA